MPDRGDTDCRNKMPISFQKKKAVRGPAERNALVVKWINLVAWSIFKKKPSLSIAARKIGYQDAMQLGNIALMRAAELWEPSKGRFANYAVHCIRWTLIRETSTRRKKTIKIDDDPLSDCYDVAQISAEELAEKKDLREAIDLTLCSLTMREKEVIECHYGIGRDPLSLADIGKKLRVSQERIRQIESRALGKLRKAHRADRLAKAIGLRRCPLCNAWHEWEAILCPQCAKEGCPHCICRREMKDGELIRCCKKCLPSLQKQHLGKGWDGYTPLFDSA